MCECFIFLYLGLGLLSFGNQAVYDPLYIVCACFTIFVSRTHIFLILGISNYIPGNEPVPLMQQILIWFSGLRGAVAFALGVTFLELPNFTKEVKGIIFGTTVMVVVLTVLILGGLTPYMLVWLGIQEPSTGSPASDPPKEEDEYELSQKYINKPFFGWLYRFDATYFFEIVALTVFRYIRPYFTDLSNDHFAQIVRRISQPKDGKDFIALKNLDEGEIKATSYDTNQTMKTAPSDDVLLEAVSLN